MSKTKSSAGVNMYTLAGVIDTWNFNKPFTYTWHFLICVLKSSKILLKRIVLVSLNGRKIEGFDGKSALTIHVCIIHRRSARRLNRALNEQRTSMGAYPGKSISKITKLGVNENVCWGTENWYASRSNYVCSHLIMPLKSGIYWNYVLSWNEMMMWRIPVFSVET